MSSVDYTPLSSEDEKINKGIVLPSRNLWTRREERKVDRQ